MNLLLTLTYKKKSPTARRGTTGQVVLSDKQEVLAYLKYYETTRNLINVTLYSNHLKLTKNVFLLYLHQRRSNWGLEVTMDLSKVVPQPEREVIRLQLLASMLTASNTSSPRKSRGYLYNSWQRLIKMVRLIQ